MKEIWNFRWRPWIRAGLVLPALLAGCLCRDGGFVDKCATIPSGAIPPPIGTHTNEIIARQVAKAELDQFVIYLYEWAGDSPNFGPFGARHIDRMAARLPKVPAPVVIEADCDPGINEARRLTVIAYLEQHGIASAGDIVHVGFPQAEGLYGEEAPRIFRQMLVPPNAGFGNRGGFQSGFQGGNLGGLGGSQGLGNQLR